MAATGIPYVVLEHRTYYYRRVIPPDARHLFDGKTSYKKSLATHDRRTAVNKAGAETAYVDALIALARGKPEAFREFAYATRARADDIRRQFPDKEDPRRDDLLSDLFEDTLDRYVDTSIPGGWAAIMERDPINPSKIGVITDHTGGAGLTQVLDMAFGRDGRTPTDLHVEAFLRQYEVEEKSKRMAASTLKKFSEVFPKLGDVTKGKVAEWRQELADTGKSRSTIQRDGSMIKQYFLYLEEFDLVTGVDEMFKLRPQKRRRKGSKFNDTGYIAWSDEECVHIWRTAPSETLADLIWFGMWTGARIDEICMWRPEHITDDFFIDNWGGKTENAVRVVPIHPELRPRVIELIERGGPFIPCDAKDRSAAMSKKFRNHTEKLGLHVLRNV